MLNYSLQDLLAVTTAILLFPLFVFVPGYMLGVTLDLFQFRERTPLIRSLLSVPFSISLTPILVFLVGRISYTALGAVYLIVWLGFAATLTIARLPKPYGTPVRKGAWRWGFIIAAGVAAVLCVSLIDLQIGHRLYNSMSAYDYNFRAAVIDSIARRGLPPINPFLHPGHDAPFRYHYFWFMICSLVTRLAGPLVSARQAQIAGTAWMGVCLCAMVALYLRFFDPRGALQIRKRALAGIVLLAVTGLDIFPVLLKSVSNILHHTKLGVFASAEWWSADPVTSWVHALLWVPHHVAGVIACLTGFLILWNLNAQASLSRRAVAWVAAGLSFASATGLSIHVTLVFACAVLVWGAVALWQRWFRRTADLAAAGLAAVLFAAPYLLTLVSSGEGSGTASVPLRFGVRQFRPLDAVLDARGASPRTFAIADLLALPLNYLVELGFFAIVAVLFLRRPRSQDPATREYRFAMTSLFATVLLVCAFVRSNVIGNNDLGWRGILIAQFLLVIVAVDYLLSLRSTQTAPVALSPLLRALLVAFFVLGLLPSFFELGTQRFHTVLMDANLIAPDLWAGEETGVGLRTASLREVYRELETSLPSDAIVQHNPSSMQDVASGLYADRQRVLMGTGDYTSFGGNPKQQESARRALLAVFLADSTEAELENTCRALHVRAVIVKDNDPVWLNPRSWVWTRQPLVAAPAARAFACSP